MAITIGALLEICNVGELFGNEVRNVWQYEVDTSVPTITAANIAEAWWQHVKAAMRGVPTTNIGGAFRTVEVRELNNPSGALGTYGIPSSEWAGTRSPGSEAQILPPFAAVSVRLDVGTRVTRPGQKRLGGLVETDQNGGLIQSAVQAATETLMDLMIQSMTLGAPAATFTMTPIVCKKDGVGAVVAHQGIDSYTISPYVSTQNSRKFGRGS
jgi:hypothetical protein